ncbi:MAG: sulfotransferase [Candidatus Woesearchaeota archaeon]
MVKPIRLICTLCPPTHSGATLLSLIIGAHKDILNVDEACYLEAAYSYNRECSCGKEVQKCSYWNSIINQYNKKISKMNISEEVRFDFNKAKIRGLSFESNNLQNKNYIRKYNLDKIKLLNFKNKIKQYFVKKDAPEKLFGEKQIKTYVNKNYYLFKIFRDYTNTNYIIDTSKSIWRFSVLNTSKLFDIKFLVLFRDGREIISSQMDSLQGIKDYLYKSGLLTFVKTIKWELYIKNIYDFIREIKDEQYKIITYDDFANEPQKTLNEIGDFINIQFPPGILNYESSNFFLNSEHHIYTPPREDLKRLKSIKKIKPVYKWKSMLTRKDNLIFNLFGGALFNKMIKCNNNK